MFTLRFGTLFFVFGLLLSPGITSPAPAADVTIVTDSDPSAPVRYALEKVKSALREQGITPREATSMDSQQETIWLLAGLSKGSGAAAGMLGSSGITPPQAPESLLIWKLNQGGRSTLLVTGADDRGLMYALLEVAARVEWAASTGDPFDEVQDTSETPAVSDRALSIYTMHRRHFESRFFDEKHWNRYLDLLASSRFNTFVLIFGYENAGYFAPAYPYFFGVEGFPEVRVVNFTREDQERHFQALKRLIRMVHDHGLDFTVGLWDHIYRGGVQSGGMDVKPGQELPGVVTGLTQKNLVAYHQAALTKFLRLFPEVDAVQFRMHGESGLKREEMHGFWKSIYEIMIQHAPHMRFNARAKGFPDSLIDLAVQMGVPIRISTKYWAEQMGLPFHPTHIPKQNQFDRRHGYADLLRYPKKYDMHWRLWNGGTTRVLLWGDPGWVRRFLESTHLYDGHGFEVNEMLATKMASQPHDMEPFELLNSKYRYYDYEFERYWHFFQVFGRIGYNPKTSAEVWEKEFERRFGKGAAPHIAAGLHRASWVLPMINSYNFPYNRFPTTRGWAEKQRREDLPAYARADGSDTQQFLSMKDAARLILSGEGSAKIWPQASSRWFSKIAEEILSHVQRAEKHIGPYKNHEFLSTVTDLRILAHLARYHSQRALAGLGWALWEESEDLNALDDAIQRESQAIQAWQDIVQAAGDIYNENLRMGLARSGLSGHWKDELQELKKGLKDIEAVRQNFRPKLDEDSDIPLITHVPVRKSLPGQEIVIRATIAGKRPVGVARIVYSAGAAVEPDNGGKSRFKFAEMREVAPFVFHGRIPETDVGEDLRYFIEAVDENGHWITYPSRGRVNPINVSVTSDTTPPLLQHTPIAKAPAAKALTIRAQASDPSGIQWVRLRFRSVNQHYEFQALPMLPTGKANEYEAVVPAEHISPRWDFMYFVEVMDNASNGKIYPDLYRETPYVVVRLER